MIAERAWTLLEGQRAEAEELLRDMTGAGDEDRSAENEHGDPSDRAQPLTAQGIDDALGGSVAARLQAIGRAEQRLREGSYGFSVRSGAPIPDERLEALPTAELTEDEAAEGDGVSPAVSTRS